MVEIDEPPRLWATVTGSERWETGGTLTVTHDDAGPLRITGPAGTVPPTTPFAMPPATPFPEKSASSVTFADRSMSGSTSGILMGAVRT